MSRVTLPPAAIARKWSPRSPLRCLVAVSVIVASGALASAAAADPPVTSTGSLSITAVLTDACPFPITVDSAATYRQTVFFDHATGALTSFHLHLQEQDTFSANGHTLVGTPFQFEYRVAFDENGNQIHQYASGVVEKVDLPGGGQFIAAGRADFINHPGASFLITPDMGATVNLDRFCAALAP